MIANAFRGKDSPVAKPEDFIPSFMKDDEGRKKKQDVQVQKNLLTAVFGPATGNKWNPIPAGKKKRKRWFQRLKEKKENNGENRRIGCSD